MIVVHTWHSAHWCSYNGQARTVFEIHSAFDDLAVITYQNVGRRLSLPVVMTTKADNAFDTFLFGISLMPYESVCSGWNVVVHHVF